MIYKATVQEALNVSEPKQMVFIDDYVMVYTGNDIPVEHSLREIEIREFRNRFTQQELLNLTTLAYSGDTTVRLLLLKVQTAKTIDLNSSDVISGLDYLVSKSVITVQRKAEILT